MTGMSENEQTLEGVNEELHTRGATDGLPVVPPTEDRVTELLRGTDLSPDEVLATVGEREGAVTVRKLAINAVMAGCAPIHLPVLVAGARAMDDPASNVDAAAVDPGSWAFQWIVNGPVREDLDIRSDTGAFGPGFWANRTIGRALGLTYQNTALVHPDSEETGVTGNPFKYTLVAGENEDRSPWAPFHVDAGYDREDSTITLSARRSFVQFIPYEMDAEGVLRAMQYNTTPDMVAGSAGGTTKTVVHTIAPYNAEELGEAGLTKQDLKEYLAENSVRPADELGAVDRAPGAEEATATGAVEPLQAKTIESPEHVQVYVVGGSGRFSAVGHTMGGPVTQQIEFPSEWETLLDEYSVERNWGEITEEYDR